MHRAWCHPATLGHHGHRTPNRALRPRRPSPRQPPRQTVTRVPPPRAPSPRRRELIERLLQPPHTPSNRRRSILHALVSSLSSSPHPPSSHPHALTALALAATDMPGPPMTSAEKSLFPNSMPVRQLPGIHSFSPSPAPPSSTTAAGQAGSPPPPSSASAGAGSPPLQGRRVSVGADQKRFGGAAGASHSLLVHLAHRSSSKSADASKKTSSQELRSAAFRLSPAPPPARPSSSSRPASNHTLHSCQWEHNISTRMRPTA